MSKRQNKSGVAGKIAGGVQVATEERPTEAKKARATGVLWEIADKYSRAQAVRINDAFTGEPTQFAMVYGLDVKNTDGGTEAGHWQPVRPVSDRYKPLKTEDVVKIACERLEGEPLMEERVRTDRFGTSLKVTIPINKPIQMPKKPFDAGHEWTRFGRNEGEIVYPTIDIRNSYDATSGIIVSLGIFRLVCSNGAKITLAGMSTKAIHTRHEVARVIDEVARMEWSGLPAVMEKLTSRKLSASAVAKILKPVPEKWQKKLVEYAKMGDNSAWAWMNGLSYLQTHEYSLLRGRQLDPVSAAIQRLAMAA